jgi:transposase-like protein
MRWKGNPVCPHCGKHKPYKLKDGKAWRCANKDCKKNFSVTKGTVFENSKIPLSKWVATIYILTAKKGYFKSSIITRYWSYSKNSVVPFASG